MDIPDSMKADLARWNGGAGIALHDWIGCVGSYDLAVGDLTVFWPEFVAFEGYILRRGFSEASLRGFEAAANGDRRSVEWVMNHLHIADIHAGDAEALTDDKAIVLGRALRDIHAAKLAYDFPQAPCIVELTEFQPGGDLQNYQLSFWQARHAPA